MQLLAAIRDKHGDRSLRRRLFSSILQSTPQLSVDGMAADDGHNAQLPTYRCPSNSIFEYDFGDAAVWCFPPAELIGPLLKFLHGLRRARRHHHVVLCVPERTHAGWFHYLRFYRRLFRYVAGSDLFRERNSAGLWKRLPPTREAWLILSSEP